MIDYIILQLKALKNLSKKSLKKDNRSKLRKKLNQNRFFTLISTMEKDCFKDQGLNKTIRIERQVK